MANGGLFHVKPGLLLSAAASRSRAAWTNGSARLRKDARSLFAWLVGNSRSWVCGTRFSRLLLIVGHKLNGE